MDNLLQVKVQNPREILYHGKAIAVSSVNSQGKFDIMGQHANFITWIQNNEIVIITDKKQKIIFPVSQGIIYNFKNSVSVFLNPQSSYTK